MQGNNKTGRASAVENIGDKTDRKTATELTNDKATTKKRTLIGGKAKWKRMVTKKAMSRLERANQSFFFSTGEY